MSYQPNLLDFGQSDGGSSSERQQADGGGHNQRVQQTQAQVNEVVRNLNDRYALVIGIMKVNVEKVLERDAKLTHLDDRAEILQEGAFQFERSAATLKRKYWWKNCKMIIIMCGIGVVLLIIIIVYSTTSKSPSP